MLDVWEMEDVDFIIVNLNKYGRPATLTRFLGIIARRHQYAPINCKSWKEMPKEDKDTMPELIETKKANGVSPERKDIYINTHTHKDGSIVNEKAAVMIEN